MCESDDRISEKIWKLFLKEGEKKEMHVKLKIKEQHIFSANVLAGENYFNFKNHTHTKNKKL